MPCPHHDIKIIQRSNHQSAVASAAYQSGERLFSEYDQKQKYYSHKSEIVHTEIMLPPHAPPAYPQNINLRLSALSLIANSNLPDDGKRKKAVVQQPYFHALILSRRL